MITKKQLVRTSFLLFCKNLICFCLLILFLTSCTIEAKVFDLSSPSQSEALMFNESFLDFSGLHPKVFSTEQTSSGELQVNLNMEEYVYKNKAKFVNLPDGALLQCSGTSSNLALQSLDLDSTESFSTKLNYWVPTAQEWLNIEDQSFSCWYELAGIKSQTITFKVALKESDIVRVSVPNYTGVEHKGPTSDGKISGNGEFVVFTTLQDGVVAGDENGVEDVFVKELSTGKITVVSKSSSGQFTNGDSADGSLSSDGRYVAFSSSATNLVSGDTNEYQDIFVHDRQTGVTTRVSVDSSGVQGNAASFSPALSADGRYVAFGSGATNLVSGDTNGTGDIFVHDRQTGVTTRVSVDSSGVQGNGYSFPPTISADGRYVAFASDSVNLVSGDTNGNQDIFVHDRQAGATTRVSVDSSGVQANSNSSSPSMSSDGRYIAFYSFASNLVSGDTNTSSDIFVHDRQTGVTSRVSVDSSGVQAATGSYNPSLSGDGRYVAFQSSATNLISGDTNSKEDTFVRDLQTGVTSRISMDSSSVQGNGASYSPVISSDGRMIIFSSEATNLVAGDTNGGEDVFVHDRQTGVTSLGSMFSPGGEGDSDSNNPSLSADGRYVVFQSDASNLVPGDTNGWGDVFIHDRQSGVTSLISVDSSGTLGDSESAAPSISADGRYVAFQSYSANLVSGDTNGYADIFVRDRQAGVTTRVSVDSSSVQGNNHSLSPTISADGRYVSFYSFASNLVAGDTNGKQDIFVHDRQTGVTSRVSMDSSGTQGNGDSFNSFLSSDGRYVVFTSDSTNLVSGDTNGAGDIFVHDRQTGITSRVSVDSSGAQVNGSSYYASINANGRYIVFESMATNLVSGDTNGVRDLFIHDQQTGATSRVSVDSSGVQANSYSSNSKLSADGRYVAFESAASNLVAGDTNSFDDIFVHDRQTGVTTRVSASASGLQGNSDSYAAALSADGRYVAFESYASTLISGDVGWNSDIFVRKNK